MWLVHETTLSNLKQILEDGVLKPSSKTQRERHGEFLDHVFMSVLFDDEKIEGKGGPIDALLFFPLDLMKKYTPSHWSPEWNYGDTAKKSVKYKKSLTPQQNAELWQEVTYAKPLQNEVVFEKEIPASEIAFVYLRKKYTAKIEIPNPVVDTKQKLNKLLAT